MNPNSILDPAVYALMHNGGVFYVGRTSINIEERMWQHVHRARSGHRAPVYEWMRDVGIANVSPEVLERLPFGSDPRAVEAAWIKRLIEQGADLKNRMGRDGTADSMPEDMKATMGASRRGKVTWISGKRGEEAGWTDERKAALRASRADAAKNRTPKHGKLNEYLKFGCRCGECVAANVEKNALYNQRRRAAQARAGIDPMPKYRPRVERAHGTPAMYKHGECRCEPCKAANRDYYIAFRERHASGAKIA